ncbi:trace amine-associated receptor 4-like [Protopterus annectens]|uniref:trace amine-associated receptor 4-like n=1 Tax=Protopterus annectens TaxID=7888 RepID=UPI001CF9B50F|nr:trace amine-associated receptor 4-like [Protopterus annectens]
MTEPKGVESAPKPQQSRRCWLFKEDTSQLEVSSHHVQLAGCEREPKQANGVGRQEQDYRSWKQMELEGKSRIIGVGRYCISTNGSKETVNMHRIQMNKSASESLEEVQFCFPSIEGSCIKNNLLPSVSVVIYTFLTGIILTALCGNLLVIISVSHFRQLHSPTNFLTLSLAFTDFFVGSLILPFSMIRSIEACWYFGSIFCKVHSVLDSAFTTVSVLHLCFISIDRYFAICDPLHYSSKITFPVTAMFLSVCWAVPTCFGFSLVFSSKNLDEATLASFYCKNLCIVIFDKMWSLITSLLVFFIPFTLMSGIYSKIFAVARNHSAAINNTAANITTNTEKHSSGLHNVETKAAKTLGLITGAFLFCWLPFPVILVLNSLFNVSVSSFIYETFSWLAYSNSACNPIIYGYFYPWFRTAFKTILSGKIFTRASSCINLFPGNH